MGYPFRFQSSQCGGNHGVYGVASSSKCRALSWVVGTRAGLVSVSSVEALMDVYGKLVVQALGEHCGLVGEHCVLTLPIHIPVPQ